MYRLKMSRLCVKLGSRMLSRRWKEGEEALAISTTLPLCTLFNCDAIIMPLDVLSHRDMSINGPQNEMSS